MIKVQYVSINNVPVATIPKYEWFRDKSRFINFDNVKHIDGIKGMLFDELGKELGESELLKVVFVDDSVLYTLPSDELMVMLNSPCGKSLSEYQYVPSEAEWCVGVDQWNQRSQPPIKEGTYPNTIYCMGDKQVKAKKENIESWD